MYAFRFIEFNIHVLNQSKWNWIIQMDLSNNPNGDNAANGFHFTYTR